MSERPQNLTYSGDVMRVVFRPNGCAAVVSAVFSSVWICFWAAGEAFAINLLLAFAGANFRLPFFTSIPNIAPKEWPSIGAIAFLLVWLSLWTFGGVGALMHVVRMFFGSDAIEISPSQWRTIHSYGLFARTKGYERGSGWSAEMRHRDRALVARREDQTRVVTTFGTPTEREWVAAEIVRVFGPPRQVDRELPKEYVAVREADAVVVRNTQKGRGCVLGCGVFCLIVGIAPFVTLIVNPRALDPLEIAVLGFFGLLTLCVGAWTLFARLYWVMRRNYFCEHLTFPGMHRKWETRGGRLEIEMTKDSDGDENYTLYLNGEGGKRKRLLSRMNEPQDTLLLGRFIEKQTGWQLVVPHGLVSSSRAR